MRAMLKGIAASDGVVCGHVFRYSEPDLSITKRSVTNLDHELNRFHQALEAAVSEVETIKTRATKNWALIVPRFLVPILPCSRTRNSLNQLKMR